MNRNPILQVGNALVKTLGDPHMGRSFLNGVPLERRGDREKMQWDDFTKSLMQVVGVSVHVNMGDVFDKRVVPFHTILMVAEIYMAAAVANPHCHYFIIKGNHDGSREADRRSAFDILAMLLRGVEGITVVDQKPEVFITNGTVIALIPWDAFKTAHEMVASLPPGAYDAIFGHWDTMSFNGKNDNLLPLEELQTRTKLAVTGHDHNFGEFEVGELKVVKTGSMQPYTHAEDPGNTMYVTFDLGEMQRHLERFGPTAFHNSCLRLDLKPGEKLEEVIDCLQLTVRRVGADGNEELAQVTMGDFDFAKLFGEVLNEAGVEPNFQNLILNRFNTQRSVDA